MLLSSGFDRNCRQRTLLWTIHTLGFSHYNREESSQHEYHKHCNLLLVLKGVSVAEVEHDLSEWLKVLFLIPVIVVFDLFFIENVKCFNLWDSTNGELHLIILKYDESSIDMNPLVVGASDNVLRVLFTFSPSEICMWSKLLADAGRMHQDSVSWVRSGLRTF